MIATHNNHIIRRAARRGLRVVLEHYCGQSEPIATLEQRPFGDDLCKRCREEVKELTLRAGWEEK
jgi:hypothetical protein